MDQLQVLKVILERLESKLQYNALCEIWGAAAKGKEGKCLEYLLETFPTQIPIVGTLESACSADNTCAVGLLLGRSYVSVPVVVLTAVKMGSMNCMLYLHAEHSADCWVLSTMTAALAMRQVHLVLRQVHLVLQLLRHGCPYDKDTLKVWLNDEEQALRASSRQATGLARQTTLTEIRFHLLQV